MSRNHGFLGRILRYYGALHFPSAQYSGQTKIGDSNYFCECCFATVQTDESKRHPRLF